MLYLEEAVENNGRLFISSRVWFSPNCWWSKRSWVCWLTVIRTSFFSYFWKKLVRNSFFSPSRVRCTLEKHLESRSGPNFHHLFNHATFAQRLVQKVDSNDMVFWYYTEAEILRYQVNLNTFWPSPLSNLTSENEKELTERLRLYDRWWCRLYTRGRFCRQEKKIWLKAPTR